MVTWLIAQLVTWKARLIGIGVIVLALVALRAWDISHQRAIGAQRAVVKIEKANAKAVSTTDRVRAKSRAGGLRGKRDPYTLDE